MNPKDDASVYSGRDLWDLISTRCLRIGLVERIGRNIILSVSDNEYIVKAESFRIDQIKSLQEEKFE